MSAKKTRGSNIGVLLNKNVVGITFFNLLKSRW